MAVFSASAPKAISYGDNPFSFTFKQLTWLVGGVLGAWFFSNFDYRRLKHFAGILAIFVLISLALVKFSPLGVTVNEAKRWLVLGPIQFQPSEIMKIALIIFMSAMISKDPKRLQKFWKGFVPYLVLVGVIAVLLLLENIYHLFLSTGIFIFCPIATLL